MKGSVEHTSQNPAINSWEGEYKKVFGFLEYYKTEKLNLIPLAHGDKKPVSEWKEYQRRKITEEEINEFFLQGTHNIGVVCGAISDNLFVIDFDTEEIFKRFFPKADGLTVVKTGRGYHVYFKADHPVKTLKIFDSEEREVMTVKGEGGYVVAPPSLHPSGVEYKFVQRGEIPKLKGDVRQQVKEHAIALGLTVPKEEKIDLETLLKGVPEGNRDNSLTYLIHYLRRGGREKPAALKICEAWNKQNRPPLGLGVVHDKVEYHYGLSAPYSYFFSHDPAQWVITDTLSLKKKEKRERVEFDAEDVDRRDVFYLDERGRRRVDFEILLENICTHYIFKVADDTETVFVYHNGIYVVADTIIKKYVEKALGSVANRYIVSEIIGHIQRRHYTPRVDFNAEKGFLPLENGLLNLETMELEPFDPEKIFTFKIPVEFDKNADCPNIKQFFREVLYEEDIATIQEIFGYCLYPDYPAHKSFWWFGSGRNGKSQMGNLLVEFIGKENVSRVPLTALDGSQRFATARLYGKLLNLVAEPGTKKSFETEMFKAATGSDPLGGELKNIQKPLDFVNFAKFVVYANKVPLIADETDAFWQRVVVITFPNKFVGENAIKNYYKVLIEKDGLSGLLNWALEGLKRLRDNNWEFSESRSQKEAKENMRRRSQPVVTFLEEWCVPDLKSEIPKEVMYDAYKKYCDCFDVFVSDEASFTKDLKQHAYIKITRPWLFVEGKNKRVLCWKGLKFNENVKIEIEDAENEKEVVTLAEFLLCQTGQTGHTFSGSPIYGGNRGDIDKRAVVSPIYKQIKNPLTTLTTLTKRNTSVFEAKTEASEHKKNVCDICGRDTFTYGYQGMQVCSDCQHQVALSDEEDER